MASQESYRSPIDGNRTGMKDEQSTLMQDERQRRTENREAKHLLRHARAWLDEDTLSPRGQKRTYPMQVIASLVFPHPETVSGFIQRLWMRFYSAERDRYLGRV
jgi:hypothetical protein